MAVDSAVSLKADKNVDIVEEAEAPLLDLKTLVMASLGWTIFEGTGQDLESNAAVTYLRNYYRRIAPVEHWPNLITGYLDNPSPADLVLLRLANHYQLTVVELLALALVLAVEEDPMTGQAIAYLQSNTRGARPTLGLIETALSVFFDTDEGFWIAGHLISGRSVAVGIMSVHNPSDPLPERLISIPTNLVLALRGFDANGLAASAELSPMELPATVHELAAKHARSLLAAENSVLVIRSASPQEGRATAQLLCRELTKQASFISADVTDLLGLGPVCIVNDVLPVFEFDLSPSEQKKMPVIAGYSGPRLALAGPDGNISSENGSLLQWHVTAPTYPERKALWAKYLHDDELAEKLARKHIHSPGRIKELADNAYREACIDQRSQTTEEDVESANWSSDGGNFSALAQAVRFKIDDSTLVLQKNIKKELNNLLHRCENRELLDQNLGDAIRARYQSGVRILLVGPSGTGKTLVASWLANKLGLPLYRVDLASVVSKYIGETEKNLANLLAKAEAFDVVLLFDEADSLFGKRTEIKDSTDRYANSQTNYLLQRIETYRGIIVLTSNSRSRFDGAFTRRLDKIIELPLPAPDERRQLWRSHLGSLHSLSKKQLNQLALKSDICGGHIRNAVLSAEVIARSEDRQINFADVIEGVASEYRKLGRQLPAALKAYLT